MIDLLLVIVVVWGIAMVLLEREFRRLERQRIMAKWADLYAGTESLRQAFVAFGVAARKASGDMQAFGAKLTEALEEAANRR